MQLMKSERFLNEYKQFQDKISRISDQKIKLELTDLLKTLVRIVKEIDSKHRELSPEMKLPNELIDKRTDLLDVRKKISKKISECEKARLIHN